MTNREILNTPKEKLSSIDRHKQHTLQVELTPVPCPVCRTRVAALTAAGLDVDQYEFGNARYDYCRQLWQALLELVVRVSAFGVAWHCRLRVEWSAAVLPKARACARRRPKR